MNRMILLFAAASVAAVSVAAPVVSDVTFVQQASGKVVISYVLTGDPAVVTLSLLRRNGATWSPVPDENVVSLLGEVNCVVTPSAEPKTVYWNAPADLTDAVADEFKAQVEAWPLDALPEFASVGLTAPCGCPPARRMSFYRSKAAIPGGIADRRYKTDTLLLRKICAKDVVWAMGDDSASGDSGVATRHFVRLTQDYYIGVYEFTFGQYSNLCANASVLCGKTLNTAACKSGTNSEIGNILNHAAMAEDIFTCPLTYISTDNIRGDTQSGPYEIAAGNRKHDVEPGRFLDCLRAASGYALAFDLPTEAQWEYACNAGTFTKYYYGTSYDATKCNAATGTTSLPVGSYDPNPWDLYDMYGNAAEMCLDAWNKTLGVADKANPAVDPCGDDASAATDMYRRPTRGGSYSSSTGTGFATTYYRYRMPNGNNPYAHIGFRIACPAVVTVE